ncbi:MAG: transcription termination/antitermination protein NusG [Patescibacteria group bacterium]|mgnify:CR=1 FL=1
MEDDDQKQLNTPTQEPEQPSEEAPKSSEPEAVGEAPQSEEVGVSEDTGVEQTHSEAQDTTQESESSEPSGASATDEVPTVKKNDNPNAKWYVVHTYSGHENRVAAALKQRVESEGLASKILDILVPMQDKIEIRSGKKQTIKEKIFPGYILVKMVLDDTSWLAVRTTQGVTSFVGIGNKPTPISDAEVQTIVKFTQEEAPVYKQVFAVSDTVKIIDGPFADFIGKVDSLDEEKGKLRILVSIFGRETPVELDFLQVQKI